ncbi:hypothetical protein P691DRAFT_583368 [Macrolepiota fuliginosa MF-IS2]|uniref:Uncharacterized protein n=1 Tax=Macrolepiota fuliginosa MF-IS2 TaxID=1400762 RepID=A0A9P6C6K2_9AGAR|nr:hypothetical protein P691DRAFT_583368 [Macrolepiota fuliginosa MF-IS2]
MPPYHIVDLHENHLPGVHPPRPGVVTFSAQRYDPRPPLPLHSNGLIPVLARQDTVDAVEVPPMIHALSFPHPGVVGFSTLAGLLTRQNGRNTNKWYSWTQKLYSCYSGFVTSIIMVKEKAKEALMNIWLHICNGLALIWNRTTRTTNLLLQDARNVVDPAVASRASVLLRVEIQ